MTNEMANFDESSLLDNKTDHLLEKTISIKPSFSFSEDPSNIHKEKQFCYRLKSFLSNLKEIVFIIILTLSNVTNLSIINIPYMICGLFFTVFFLNRDEGSMKCKNLIVKISLIYNYLAIITKIVCIIFQFTLWRDNVTEIEKKFLIDLGLVFLKETSFKWNWINTFLCDTVVFFGMIILNMYNYDAENYVKTKAILLSNFTRNYLVCVVLSILLMTVVSSLNLNFLTITYTVIINLSLIFLFFENQFRVFRCSSYVVVLCSLINIGVSEIMSLEGFEMKEFKVVVGLDSKIYYTTINYVLNVIIFNVSLISIKLRYSFLKNLEKERFMRNSKESNHVTEQELEYQTSINRNNLLSNLKSMLQEWFYSPYFILHFCRVSAIMVIIWYENLVTTLLLIWLFMSFLIKRVGILKYLTLFIVWPVLLIIFYCYYLLNIPYFIEIVTINKEVMRNLALQKFEIPQLNILFIYLVMTIFTIFTKLLLNNNERPPVIQVRIKRLITLGSVITNDDGDNINNEQNRKSDAKRSANLLEVFLKFFLTYMDKITLILMYFIAVNNISILNFILVIIFLIQLIFPQAIKTLCYSIILIIEILILFEHTISFIHPYIEITPAFRTLFELIMNVDNKGEPAFDLPLYYIIYCFYLQYQNYNSDIYLKYDSDEYSFNTYLENKLKDHEHWKKLTKSISYMAENIFIWLIFILFFVSIIMVEIQLLFAIKLIFYFSIVYLFLQFNYSHKISRTIIIYIWILIIYCGIATTTVYFFQFTGNTFIEKLINDFITESNQKNFLNLVFQFIGIKLYEESLILCLFPHYFSNLLSVLLLNEMTRILERSKAEDYLLSTYILERHIKEKIEVFEKDIDLFFDCDLELNEISILKEKEIVINKTVYKYSKNKFYIYKVLFFIVNTYWYLITFLLAVIVIYFQLSIIMLLYIIILCSSFLIIFKKFINYIESKSTLFYLSKIIKFERYEKRLLRTIIMTNRANTFRILIIINFLSIILTYIFGVFQYIDFISNHQSSFESIRCKIRSFSYICGIYNDKNKNFLSNIWGHLFLLSLLIIDRYVCRFSNFLNIEILKTKFFIQTINFYRNKARVKERQFFLCIEQQKLKNMHFPNNNTTDKISVNNSESIEVTENNQPVILRNSTKNKKKSFFKEVESKINVQKCKVFRRFLIIFHNKKHFPYNTETSTKNINLDLQKTLKTVLGEIIVMIIFICAIVKMNIFSIFYLMMVLLLQKNGRSVHNIYITFLFLSIFIILQYAIFITNLNNLPGSHLPEDLTKDMLNKIYIPLFSNLGVSNNEFLYYFSSGKSSQIVSLWVDILLVILCILYLENFSFSIFDMSNYNKFNINVIQDKEGIRDLIRKIDEIEYKDLKDSLDYNFGIKLSELKDLRLTRSMTINKKPNLKETLHDKKPLNQSIFLKKGRIKRIGSYKPAKSRQEDSNQVRHRCWTFFYVLKKNVYLKMHLITLILIMTLSLVNDCLIGIVYIAFALYYIYMANMLLLAQKWNFPKTLTFFLRPFLFLDIFITIIYQNPVISIYNSPNLNKILNILGINTIISEYSQNIQYLKKEGITLLVFKVIAYILVSIQIIIYRSKDFKSFYLSYLLKMKESTYKSSMIKTFLFNNLRIMRMNSSMRERNQIEETLDNLEKQLEQWNQNLKEDLFKMKNSKQMKYVDSNIFVNSSYLRTKRSNPSIQSPIQMKKLSNHSLPTIEEECLKNKNSLSEIDLFKQKLKSYIYNTFLIKLSIFLNESNFSYKFLDKDMKKKMELEIIKGRTYIKSTIEKRIEKFIDNLNVEDENYQNLIKLIREEMETENCYYLKNKKDYTSEKKINYRPKNIINQLDNKEENKNDVEVVSEPNETEKVSITNENHDVKSVRESHILLNEANSSFSRNKKIEKELQDIMSKQKLFTMELTKCFLIKFILKNISYYFLDNFHYIVYFFMIMNHIINNCLISLFWPLAVFGWALVDYPRPKNVFWRICLVYCIITILFKFAFSMKNSIEDTKNSDDNDEFKIGIKSINLSLSFNILNYFLWDILLMLLIAVEQYILINNGLWISIEPQLETMEEAYERVYMANSEKFNDKDSNDYFFLKSINLFKAKNEKLEEKKKRDTLKMLKGCNIVRSYYRKMFPKIRNNKPGKDYYTHYFISTLLIILWIICFYPYMDNNVNFQNLSDLKIRQLSGTMVLIALLHVIVIVIDRIIYIKQSRQSFTHDNFYFSRENGEKYTEEAFLKMNIPENEQFRYIKIYFQMEDLNLPLITKYILHLFLLFFSHFLIFWYLPIRGNINSFNTWYCPVNDNKEKNDCNDFLSNKSIIVFYLLYLFYYSFSALQIQHGLLDTRKKSVLMRGENLFNLILFKTYKAIPFLYELKLTIDWTITPTSLDIFKWIKFESVYDLLFMTHCTMRQEKFREVGEKIGFLEKSSFGGIVFVIILIILLGPLIIFSNLNPTNSHNNVTGAHFDMLLTFSNSKIVNNFTIYTNDNPYEISDIDKETCIKLNFSKSAYTKSFETNQIQRITMNATSATSWQISKPQRDVINKMLLNYNNYTFNITLTIRYSFDRLLAPPGDPYKSIYYSLYSTDNKTDITKIEKLNNSVTKCSNDRILLKKLYQPAIKLSSDLKPKELDEGKDLPKLDAYLKFTCQNVTSDNYMEAYWSLSIMPNNSIEDDSDIGMRFYTFSELVSQTSFNYDILSFYTAFVFLIGNLIRGFISGEAERIVITECPEPQKILNLCEGIKISRYRHDFIREEHLYSVLMDVMRSPEILKVITKSTIQYLIDKNYSERAPLQNNESCEKTLFLKKND